MHLRIDPLGQVHCLYNEAVDLTVLGPLCIQRASHVEPDDAGQWWIDLTPVAGPRLGPFRRRSDALAAEVNWLETNYLAAPTTPAPAANAPASSDKANQSTTFKVVAVVAGGVIQAALGSRPDIEFEVLDRDNYACEEEVDGETEDAAEERMNQECPHPIY